MAIRIKLSAKEEKALLERKKNERDGKILRRLLCIEMKNKGYQNQEIADLCDVCIDTITDWLTLYEKHGLKRLCELQYEGRRSSKLDPYLEEIREHIRKEHPARLIDLQTYLNQQWNLTVEESWLWRWCKKNSVLLGRNHA